MFPSARNINRCAFLSCLFASLYHYRSPCCSICIDCDVHPGCQSSHPTPPTPPFTSWYPPLSRYALDDAMADLNADLTALREQLDAEQQARADAEAALADLQTTVADMQSQVCVCVCVCARLTGKQGS